MSKYNFDEDDHFQSAEKKDDSDLPCDKRCKIYLEGSKFTRHGTYGFVVSCILYMLLFIMCLVMKNKTSDLPSDSIYTQALTDWSAKGWVDF